MSFTAAEEGHAFLIGNFLARFRGVGVGGGFADGKGGRGHAGGGGVEVWIFYSEGFEGYEPELSEFELLFGGEIPQMAREYGHFRVVWGARKHTRGWKWDVFADEGRRGSEGKGLGVFEISEVGIKEDSCGKCCADDNEYRPG